MEQFTSITVEKYDLGLEILPGGSHAGNTEGRWFKTPLLIVVTMFFKQLATSFEMVDALQVNAPSLTKV